MRRQFGMADKTRKTGLPPEFDDWLESLRSASQPPITTPVLLNPPPTARRLVYILRPQFGQVSLDVASVRLLKNGIWGAPENFNWDNILKNSGQSVQMAEEERQLAVELAWAQESPGASNRILTGETGSRLLERFIATGKCHWLAASKGKAPLSLGPVRPGELGWLTGQGGLQRTAIIMEPLPTAILGLDPLWWLDDLTATCGPIELPVISKVANLWLSAPELKAEHAPAFNKAVEEKPLPTTLPQPRKLQVKAITNCRPIPCLTLLTKTIEKPPKDNPIHEISIARLEFDYEGVLVPYGLAGETISTIRKDVYREVRRRIAMERSYAELLENSILDEAVLLPEFEAFGLKENDFVSDDPNDWAIFGQRTLPRLRIEKWRIIEDASFRWRTVEADSWTTSARPDNLDASVNDWFEIELGVIVEGKPFDLLPLLLQFIENDPKALSHERLMEAGPTDSFPLQLPDGRNLLFPISRARQIMGVLLDLFDSPPLGKNGGMRLSRIRAAEVAANEDWRWLGPQDLAVFAEKLRNFRGIQAVTPPKELRANLRQYQLEGVSWLQFLREYGLAGILADDMGLGKTIQTLAHLQIEVESGRADLPSLVIAPTSLMHNWRQEAARFLPSLRVLVLHGADRKDHFDKISQHDLVLTTYPLLARDLAPLLEQTFHYVILDEAQFIKNPKTTYAQSVCELKARHRLCLSGTPVENHLGELWSLFRFLLPGFLGDENRFNQHFRRPIERQQDENRRSVLARRIAPFLLRRRKEQVAPELPPKTEITQSVEFGPEQRDLYESVRLALHYKVQAEVAKKGLARSHIVVLDALLKLRQICCHPQLLSLPAAQAVTESAKMNALMELLVPMVAEGRRILIFSQFTSLLALIEQQLNEEKISYVQLTGDTKDRATPVESFQKGNASVFLISLKAGGTGLNLTTADTVIHYDPWWNPAVENQATDRAHRIGQIKNVFVYKLIVTGTVEEKIAALQDRKRALVEGLLSSESSGKLELGSDDIDFLFGPI